MVTQHHTDEAEELNRREAEALINRLRTTPLTWSELQTIILSPNTDDLSKLARSEEQTNTYRKSRTAIHNEWESIYDYILCTKFGFEWAEVEDTKKRRSTPTFQEYQQQKTTGEIQLKLCLNDFPYYFASGIQHWVLWKLGGVVTDDEILQAKKDILIENSSHKLQIIEADYTTAVINQDIFLHWVNPPHLKSLPGIDHVHVLFNDSTWKSHL